MFHIAIIYVLNWILFDTFYTLNLYHLFRIIFTFNLHKIYKVIFPLFIGVNEIKVYKFQWGFFFIPFLFFWLNYHSFSSLAL